MQFSTATIAAAVAFLPMIQAHLMLVTPGVYKAGDPLPPLLKSGDNFPCAVSSFATPEGEGPTLIPGATAAINLAGTALHGGGSCQISITYDQPPTANSQWKVMKSFIGGCPMKIDGNLPAASGGPQNNAIPALQYTVPSDLPGGKVTVAWSWFNRIGQREMYMRCHQATVKNDKSKDMSVLAKYPDIFVANIEKAMGKPVTCSVAEGTAVEFPNPGAQFDKPDGIPLVAPTGNCGAPGTGGTGKAPSTGGGAPAVSSPAPSSPAPPPPPPPAGGAPAPNNPPSTGGGGACTAGQKSCDDAKGRWKQCVNNAWVDMGPLAPGTTCKAIMKRNDIRFSEAHKKRHI